MPVIRSMSGTRSAGTFGHLTTAARVIPNSRATVASSPRLDRMRFMPDSSMTVPLTIGKQVKQARMLTQRMRVLPHTWLMDIGDRIKRARRDAGLSQRALAKAIGVSFGAVGQWESHVKTPGRDNVLAVAKETLVSVDWILGESPDKNTGIYIADPTEIEVIRALRRLAPPQKQNLLQFLRVAGDVAGEIEKQRGPVEVE